MRTRIRHTGIEAGIGVAAPTRAPGLRSIQEILAPVMARLAAQQFADRSAYGDVIGWHLAAIPHMGEREPREEVRAPEGQRGERQTDEYLVDDRHRPSPHPVAEREAGGEDAGPEDPALCEGEHRSVPPWPLVIELPAPLVEPLVGPPLRAEDEEHETEKPEGHGEKQP